MPRSFVLVRKCERRLGEGMEGENEWRWGGGGRAGKKRRCWIFLWSASNAQLQTPTIGSWSWRRDGDRRNQRSISVSQSSRLFNANRHAVDHVGRFLKRHASSRIDSKQPNDFYSFSSIFVRYSKEENGNSRIVSCRVFHSQSVSVFPLVNSPLVAPRFIGRLFHPRIPIPRKRTSSSTRACISLSSFPFLPTRLAFARDR